MIAPWIKMRWGFARDGRVLKVSRSCNAAPLHIVGALYALWTLADELIPEGEAILAGYTPADLDQHVGLEGFTEALPEDWMKVRPDGLYLPQYQEHNGKTAKARAQAAKRVERHRKSKKSNGKNSNASVTQDRNTNVTPSSSSSLTSSSGSSLPEGESEGEIDPANPMAGLNPDAPVSSNEIYIHNPDAQAAWDAIPKAVRHGRHDFNAEWCKARREGHAPAVMQESMVRYYSSYEGQGEYRRKPATIIRDRIWETESEESWQQKKPPERKW